MITQEKTKFREITAALLFTAIQVPDEHQQKLIIQVEGVSQEATAKPQFVTIALPEVQAPAVLNQQEFGQSLQQSQPEMLLTETENKNKKSLFIQGHNGEFKLADESITPEMGLPIPNDATDTGPIQYVGPDWTSTDLNPYQDLTPEAKAAVNQDKTLTVIQNEEGQMELAPYHESQNPDLGFDSEPEISQ